MDQCWNALKQFVVTKIIDVIAAAAPKIHIFAPVILILI
jgi:hypothetical protein